MASSHLTSRHLIAYCIYPRTWSRILQPIYQDSTKWRGVQQMPSFLGHPDNLRNIPLAPKGAKDYTGYSVTSPLERWWSNSKIMFTYRLHSCRRAWIFFLLGCYHLAPHAVQLYLLRSSAAINLQSHLSARFSFLKTKPKHNITRLMIFSRHVSTILLLNQQHDRESHRWLTVYNEKGN